LQRRAGEGHLWQGGLTKQGTCSRREETNRTDGTIAHPRRIIVSLGICRTRSIAERKCAEEIEKLGINSTQYFIESTSTITFKQQAELWLRSLVGRKRNPLEQTTLDARRYTLDK
jgi:hypothetical protein